MEQPSKAPPHTTCIDGNIMVNCALPLWLSFGTQDYKNNYYFRRTNITPWAPIIFMHWLLQCLTRFIFYFFITYKKNAFAFTLHVGEAKIMLARNALARRIATERNDNNAQGLSFQWVITY